MMLLLSSITEDHRNGLKVITKPRPTLNHKGRILKALGPMGNHLPRVDEETLSGYYKYLTANLSFPFTAYYPEPTTLLENVQHRCAVMELLDPAKDSGAVRDRIYASPTSLFRGVVEPGQKTTRQIVVRAKEPLRVTDVACDGADFEATSPDATTKKSMHLVPVTFIASRKSGRGEATIHIKTNLGAVTSIPAYATVASH